MAQHTPGPRNLILNVDQHGEDGEDAISIRWEDRSGRVPVRSTKTYKASLIADAPELLAALDRAEAQLVADGRGQEPIAKAEGK